ncbi:MAG: hypothetical protein ACR2RB_17955 [Gammaproteobacteria bacterium]
MFEEEDMAEVPFRENQMKRLTSVPILIVVGLLLLGACAHADKHTGTGGNTQVANLGIQTLGPEATEQVNKLFGITNKDRVFVFKEGRFFVVLPDGVKAEEVKFPLSNITLDRPARISVLPFVKNPGCQLLIGPAGGGWLVPIPPC